MFSVLIVDDEEPVLESYEFMLKAFSGGGEEKSPFNLVGKARTGYEALHLIHELKPDLVFMDINIPGMDGLEVLEDVYKKYPRMVCILSTAYERFDLARRAIPLGAFAYLVKPVSKKTFFSALEDALVKLNSLPSGDDEYGEARLALLRRDIWAAIDEQRWSWYRETLALPSDYGFVLIVETEHDMEVWGNRIAEQLAYKYPSIFDVLLNRGLFLISADTGGGGIPAGAFRRRTVKLLEEMLVSVSWYCGIGACYRGPELYRSCEEALAELTAKRQGDDAWGGLGGKIALLRQKIGVLPPEETKALFASIWEPLFSVDFTSAKLRMVSLFTLLLDDIYRCWSVSSTRPANSPALPPFDPAEIMGLPDLAAWKRWAQRSFDKLAEQARLERQGNYPLPLVKALGFVRENFAGSIQLGDAAEAAQVNSAHLSRLFTEHLKTSFIDYLTALRINEAEQLLKEKPVTVKEAAIACGYQDPNYFSKIFKKIKGILPTEVKERE